MPITLLTRLLRFTPKSFQHQHLVAPDQDQGWTLIEIGAITVIVGIMAAMSYPSMVGMQARNDLRSSMEAVKSAVAEAQRIAIKKGSSCTVNLTTSTVTGSPAGCISSHVTLSSGQTLYKNAGLNSGITFSYKGNTTQSGTLTISSTNTSEVKCLVISNGLGIFRTGSYTGTASSQSSSNCQKGL